MCTSKSKYNKKVKVIQSINNLILGIYALTDLAERIAQPVNISQMQFFKHLIY